MFCLLKVGRDESPPSALVMFVRNAGGGLFSSCANGKTRPRLAILEFGASLRRQHTAKEEEHAYLWQDGVCMKGKGCEARNLGESSVRGRRGELREPLHKRVT